MRGFFDLKCLCLATHIIRMYIHNNRYLTKTQHNWQIFQIHFTNLHEIYYVLFTNFISTINCSQIIYFKYILKNRYNPVADGIR